jgi:hypothetical protein
MTSLDQNYLLLYLLQAVTDVIWNYGNVSVKRFVYS